MFVVYDDFFMRINYFGTFVPVLLLPHLLYKLEVVGVHCLVIHYLFQPKQFDAYHFWYLCLLELLSKKGLSW